MFVPTNPSSAGSSVTDATIVMNTPIAIAMATPRMTDWPMNSSPRIETRTVVPAKSTARPEVSTARITRGFRSEPVVEILPVAGDHEQRVVDADADADHRDRSGREARHVDRAADDEHESDAGPDAEQRGADRQPHREHRPERDQQDDHRREDPDAFAHTARRGLLEQVTAERDVQTRYPDAVGHRLDLVAGVEERVGVAVGEVDLGVRDVAALGDLARARLRIGADDAGVAHRPRDLAEQLLHRARTAGSVTPWRASNTIWA